MNLIDGLIDLVGNLIVGLIGLVVNLLVGAIGLVVNLFVGLFVETVVVILIVEMVTGWAGTGLVAVIVAHLLKVV